MNKLLENENIQVGILVLFIIPIISAQDASQEVEERTALEDVFR